jgi:hypothetical protein
MQDDANLKAILYDLRRNQTLVGKCDVCPDFQFIRVNDVLCGYLQCTPAQLIGTKFTAITVPEDSEIDKLNAQAVKDGKIDRYQFPKRYKPDWIESTVYVVIDVVGVRDTKGKFLHYDVEVLEISQAEYLRLRRIVRKQQFGIFKRLLLSIGAVDLQSAKAIIVWAVAIGAAIGAAKNVTGLHIDRFIDHLLP